MPNTVQKVSLTLFVTILSIGCINLTDFSPVIEKKASPSFDSGKLESIEAVITQARSEKRLPGGVLWIEHRGKSLLQGLWQSQHNPRPFTHPR